MTGRDKGGARDLTSLAREHCRVRSLGLFCWPEAFGDNPCRVCLKPFSGRPTAFHAVGSGKPPARVSPAKTVHRTVFAPFPALAIAYPSRTPAGVLSGDFAACGLRLGDSVPKTPARFLRKSGVKPF